jgi:hypothetical protein
MNKNKLKYLKIAKKLFKMEICLEIMLTVGGVDVAICYFHELWDLVLVILYILTYDKKVLRWIVVLTLFEELER